jgi:cell division protease FtsH
MVTQYGMSAKAGQVYLAREKRGRFLDVPGFESPAEYSEATAELIDAEIKEIIQAQYTVALDILREKRFLLEKGAVLLLEKETITGAELQELGRSLETTVDA